MQEGSLFSTASPAFIVCRFFDDGHSDQNWLIGKDPDAGKDWKQEEKGTTEDEMFGWHHRLDGHEFEQAPGVGDGQRSLECCSPRGCKESDTTEWLNWTASDECELIPHCSFDLHFSNNKQCWVSFDAVTQFKYMNCMVCELYLKKAITKKREKVLLFHNTFLETPIKLTILPCVSSFPCKELSTCNWYFFALIQCLIASTQMWVPQGRDLAFFFFYRIKQYLYTVCKLC